MRGDRPNKIAADRSPQFELIAGAKVLDEVWRDFAAIHTLHSQSEQIVFRGRSDRIAALRLIAVFGRETQIDMLPREVSLPIAYVQRKALDPVRFDDNSAHLRELPLESPYRLVRRPSHLHTAAL